MPSARSSSAFPTPESWSSCGELIAPPQRIHLGAHRTLGCAAAAHVFDPDGSLALEEDPGDERPGLDLEVVATHHRMQVRAGRREATTIVDVSVERGEPLLAVAVHVIGEGVAGLLHGLEERAEQRIGRRTALERERPAMSAVGVAGVGCETVLHPLEVGQAMRVVPGFHPRVGAPPLVVERVPPLEDHAVDAAGAAEDLPAGVVDPAVVHEGLGLGLVLPVVERASDREGQGGRHMDEDVPEVVGPAGLQDEDPRRGVDAQAVAQGAPGGATPDDHEIVGRLHRPEVSHRRAAPRALLLL